MSKELTTNDIYRALSKDLYSRISFVGVFPRDRLPDLYSFPCSVVINTEPSYKKGEHWIALYFNERRFCEFFDSYGLPPSAYGLDKYIQRFASDWNYNKYQLQGWFSSACRYYCIYFILLKSRHFSLDDVISLFSKSDFSLNDFKVEHVYDK